MQLGLRPRLRSRPSLFDLVQKKNIDQISLSGDRTPAPKDNLEPASFPLPESEPTSPLISPLRELPSQPPPPHITLHEASDDEKATPANKMPPVSINRAVARRGAGS
jgi:hypothetical protein